MTQLESIVLERVTNGWILVVKGSAWDADRSAEPNKLQLVARSNEEALALLGEMLGVIPSAAWMQQRAAGVAGVGG